MLLCTSSDCTILDGKNSLVSILTVPVETIMAVGPCVKAGRAKSSTPSAIAEKIFVFHNNLKRFQYFQTFLNIKVSMIV